MRTICNFIYFVSLSIDIYEFAYIVRQVLRPGTCAPIIWARLETGDRCCDRGQTNDQGKLLVFPRCSMFICVCLRTALKTQHIFLLISFTIRHKNALIAVVNSFLP